MNFLPVVGLTALFMLMIYFLMIKPVRQREKQHDELVFDLERGDTVITAGGMFGKIDTIDEDSVILIVESGAMVKVTKGSILKREEGQDIRDLIG